MTETTDPLIAFVFGAAAVLLGVYIGLETDIIEPWIGPAIEFAKTNAAGLAGLALLIAVIFYYSGS